MVGCLIKCVLQKISLTDKSKSFKKLDMGLSLIQKTSIYVIINSNYSLAIVFIAGIFAENDDN